MTIKPGFWTTSTKTKTKSKIYHAYKTITSTFSGIAVCICINVPSRNDLTFVVFRSMVFSSAVIHCSLSSPVIMELFVSQWRTWNRGLWNPQLSTVFSPLSLTHPSTVISCFPVSRKQHNRDATRTTKTNKCCNCIFKPRRTFESTGNRTSLQQYSSTCRSYKAVHTTELKQFCRRSSESKQIFVSVLFKLCLCLVVKKGRLFSSWFREFSGR